MASRRRAGIGRVIAYYDLCDGMGCLVLFFPFSLRRSRFLLFLSSSLGHVCVGAVGEWRGVCGGAVRCVRSCATVYILALFLVGFLALTVGNIEWKKRAVSSGLFPSSVSFFPLSCLPCYRKLNDVYRNSYIQAGKAT